MTHKRNMTLKRKMSFLSRVDRIAGNIQKFESGQKYISESDWRQLRNMEDVIKYGFALMGGPSVHNLVQVGYISKVRSQIEKVEV